MEIFIEYGKVFLTGGIICSLGQILIDKTKITPARILTLFVTLGVILGFLGLYEPIYNFGKCGATVPISGFGYSLYKGTVKAISEHGFLVVNRMRCSHDLYKRTDRGMPEDRSSELSGSEGTAESQESFRHGICHGRP